MSRSPLFNEGWLEFNRRKWNLRPLHVRFAKEESDLPSIEAAYYLDRQGRIRQAPLHPHLPVFFQPTPTTSNRKREHQWLNLADQLAADMRRRKLAHRVSLPPSVTDMRPWQWGGFEVTVRYSRYIDLPLDDSEVDRMAKRAAERASAAGFRACLTRNMEDVHACLEATADRKALSTRLSRQDLELALGLAGEETFRCYVCYSPEGEPAASAIILHAPGAYAVGLVAGTRDAYLRCGATQLLIRFYFQDLLANGAPGMDYAGGNIPSVDAAKADWGGRLVPSFGVKPRGLRGLADSAYRSACYWYRQRRGR